MLKLLHNCSISHTSKVKCSKFSKPGFNSMGTMNFQMFKADLENAEEQEIKLPTSVGLSEKQESSRKMSTSVLLIMSKPQMCRLQQTVEISSRDAYPKPP